MQTENSQLPLRSLQGVRFCSGLLGSARAASALTTRPRSS